MRTEGSVYNRDSLISLCEHYTLLRASVIRSKRTASVWVCTNPRIGNSSKKAPQQVAMRHKARPQFASDIPVFVCSLRHSKLAFFRYACRCNGSPVVSRVSSEFSPGEFSVSLAVHTVRPRYKSRWTRPREARTLPRARTTAYTFNSVVMDAIPVDAGSFCLWESISVIFASSACMKHFTQPLHRTMQKT